MNWETLQQVALSLGLGLLVGFQREWAAPHVAGVRTFALLTLFGTLCGLLTKSVGPWLVPMGLIVTGALLILGTFTRWEFEETQREDTDPVSDMEPPGLTTDVAGCVMFLVGAGLVFLPIAFSILIAGGVAVLLHWKGPIHWFIDRLGENDVRAIMQLVLLALIILPLMPDRSLEIDPYQVLNLFDIWRMVVLICGISLAGYIASRFWGETASAWISGILGGIISSTATTVTFSRQTRHRDQPSTATLILLIASTVVFGRVLMEVLLVAPDLVWRIAMPMTALSLVMAAVTGTFALIRPLSKEAAPEMAERDPTQLMTALIFGALYAVVLFAVAAARDGLGNPGLYVVSALSGMTDMDAITLSTARLVEKQQLDADTGWRMIAIGFLSNLIFKLGIVALLGSRRLLKQVAIVFGLAIVGGGLIVVFWPNIN